MIGLEDLQRERVGSGGYDIDAVGPAGQVDWGLGIGNWGLVEDRGVDCDRSLVAPVLLVDTDPFVGKPGFVAQREDVVGFIGNGCADPVVVLAVADVVGRRNGRRPASVAQDRQPRAQHLPRGADGFRIRPRTAYEASPSQPARRISGAAQPGAAEGLR